MVADLTASLAKSHAPTLGLGDGDHQSCFEASSLRFCKTNEIYCRFSTIILHYNFGSDARPSPSLFGFDMHFWRNEAAAPGPSWLSTGGDFAPKRGPARDL
ncbi:hypothetical protein ACVDG5_024600 [Mesorhizobium sp. ORM6]